MLNEYDFSNARPNPYVKKPKKQITINIDASTVDFFKAQAAEESTTASPYLNRLDDVING